MLGSFEVMVGARTIGEGDWPLKKAANLIKLLALAAGNRLHRERITYTLWPNLGISAASNNLRQTAHSARRILDPAMGSSYLASREESLVLCPESTLWVDVDAFEQAARSARRSGEPAAYEAALELYAGELLPTDRYEEWAEEPRGRLKESYLWLVVGLAKLYEEFGDYASAMEGLRQVLSEEPTREEAYAGLMPSPIYTTGRYQQSRSSTENSSHHAVVGGSTGPYSSGLSSYNGPPVLRADLRAKESLDRKP